MTLRIIVGLLGMTIGVLMVIKTRWFSDFFGPMPWAEKYLHAEGGTSLGYKLLGILVFFVCFSIMTGWVKPLLIRIFGAGRI